MSVMNTIVLRNKFKISQNFVETKSNNQVVEKQQKPKRRKRFRNFWKKTHRWIGLLISFFVLNFAISGIILNHRELFSSIDLPRKILPNEYHYMNWNNAALKSIIPLSNNENIVYGNIGIWKEQNGKFSDFSEGIKSGADNHNVHSMILTNKGNMYAGTLTAFYFLNKSSNKWTKLELPTKEQRVIKLLERNSQILLLTRSEIIKMDDNPNKPNFVIKEIKAYEGYQRQTGLFQTLWQLHSGEAFGLIGRLLVDFLALIFILLTITGLIKWYFPKSFKKLINNKEKLRFRKKVNIYSLSLHNQFGLWASVFLLFTSLSGMFLRPPLLILIGYSKVSQIPFTNLRQDNPWYDKLRNITYLESEKKYIFATDESLYSVDENFTQKPVEMQYQPEISIMGVNVLDSRADGGILVGSFSGLFLWYPNEKLIYDYVSKGEYIPAERVAGPPIGANAVSGYGLTGDGKEYYFDYNMGAVPLNTDLFFPKMNNEIIDKCGISLWNTALEFHTARIFRSIISDFYILIIPLAGLLISITIISGVILWFKIYKGKKLIKA